MDKKFNIVKEWEVKSTDSCLKREAFIRIFHKMLSFEEPIFLEAYHLNAAKGSFMFAPTVGRGLAPADAPMILHIRV